MLTEEKKSPLTHKTHHLQCLGKFLFQSYTVLSMAACQKEQHLQKYHGSRSIDVSAGDTEFIGLKTQIFIYLNNNNLEMQCSIYFSNTVLLTGP